MVRLKQSPDHHFQDEQGSDLCGVLKTEFTLHQLYWAQSSTGPESRPKHTCENGLKLSDHGHECHIHTRIYSLYGSDDWVRGTMHLGSAGSMSASDDSTCLQLRVFCLEMPKHTFSSILSFMSIPLCTLHISTLNYWKIMKNNIDCLDSLFTSESILIMR